jgi:pSer/pThr/pTyr-binding forkhead associated (FHA) protein
MPRFALRYFGHRPGASLSYFTGAGVTLRAGDTFLIGEHDVVLGRRASADLRLASSQVGPHHARLHATAEGIHVLDLGSTNGTFVNDAPVSSALMLVGDRLTIAGAFDFIVTLAPAPAE